MSLKSDPRSWSDPRHIRGFEGELLAIRYLRSTGWRILDHRFRMGRLEVDLVARKGHLVAFLEVKTRWSGVYGSPLQAVTWGKRREIVRVARAWVDRHGAPDDAYRFDVIGITMRKGTPPKLDHIEDAFRAS